MSARPTPAAMVVVVVGTCCVYFEVGNAAGTPRSDDATSGKEHGRFDGGEEKKKEEEKEGGTHP